MRRASSASAHGPARERRLPAAPAGRQRAGAAAGARRRLRPDRRGACPGRDRRGGDREGTGAAGGGPRGDLGGALDARRPAAPALAADAAERPPNPLHMEKFVYLLRAREAAFEAAKANGVAAARLRVSFPDQLSFAPVRAKAAVLADLDVGRGRARTEASATAEAAAPIGRPGGNAGDGERRRLQRPARLPPGRGDAAGRGRRLRPDGGGGLARRHLPARQLGLPLRRRAGAALRRQPRSAVGRAAGPLAAPLRDRAGPRARLRLRLAGGQRTTLRLRPALLVGALALRLRGRAATLLGGRQRGRRGWGRRGSVGAAAACPPSSRPASGRRCCGAACPLERLRRAARRAADGRVELQPLRHLPGRRGGHRPVHPLAPPPPTASAIPSTRSRRSRPRPT